MHCDGCDFSLSKAELKALISFVSTSHGGPTSQICFDPVLARVLATDGHTLITLTDDAPAGDRAGEAFGVGLVHAKKIASAAGAKCAVYFGAVGSGVSAVSDGIDMSFSASEHKFPPVDAVTPAHTRTTYTTEAAGFNPAYLARVGAVAKALGVDRVRMQPGCAVGDPIRFDVTSRLRSCSAMILIMPMRLD